jgi:hypothetical protein
MKQILLTVLCVLLPFTSSNGYKVAYDGGSVPEKA